MKSEKNASKAHVFEKGGTNAYSCPLRRCACLKNSHAQSIGDAQDTILINNTAVTKKKKGGKKSNNL